jgi:hypothetical protein
MKSETDYFVKPGSVRVSDAALAKARQFGEAIGANQSGKMIVVFFWYESGSISNPAKGTNIQLGPGISIGAARISEVPAPVICENDGFRYAIKIPEAVILATKQKLIDINPEAPPIIHLI